MSVDDTFGGSIGPTYRESTPWWPEPAAAPKGAPDVVCIVLDDVGFSDLGCYGSEIATPRVDALAQGGLRYANFHVTAMCSPTRACLLSGRNAHAAGVGIIAEWSSGFPGYRGAMTRRAATIPEVLRDHAYGTYAVGKWHLTNIANYGAAGPHEDWPLGRGFSRWYGFHGALADQWHPELCQDNRPIRLDARAGYHLSEDLVDHAIVDVRDHVTAAPDRPFFLYLAFGACHWPHHVPAEYIRGYRGRYDQGWDAIRAQRLESQLRQGIVPSGTGLAPRNPGVQAWAELSPDVRRIAVRLQETYAGFLEHTDAQIGRLTDYLASIGRLDNTLLVLLSDNGASAEGGPTGAINLRKHMVYEEESPEVVLAHLEDIGSDRAYNHYPTGWAQASNTPLKWYKKDTHGGGIRAPLIVHWPQRIADAGSIRTQFHHVVDMAPTLYEVIGVEAPAQFHGVSQLPMHGLSLAYTFEQRDVATRKQSQYFEILGDRGMWHEGWKAVTRHPKGTSFDDDRWELYHLDQDFAELRDRAQENPEKLRELVDLWWTHAREYHVLPLDDRDWERAALRLAMNTRTRYQYYAGMARTDRLSAPDITDRSYRIVARFDANEATMTEGVILAWGSRFGGIGLYLKGGRVRYRYVYSQDVSYMLEGDLPTGSGGHEIRVDFERMGNHSGRAVLAIDGTEAGRVDIPKTWPTHGVTAGLNCGQDAGAPVCDDYAAPFEFNGGNLDVVIELANDGARDPKGRYQAALNEQ
ncbi:MAG TPA: arylsulfatase [Burkholderiales bacterium]|nr:arylsulfatase [Burkholderiales bacterium]